MTRQEIGLSAPYRKPPLTPQDSLEKQIAELKLRVAILEARVKQLEKNCSTL